MAVTHKQLGLDSSEELVDTRPLGERMFDEIGSALSTCIAFGHYRLDEQKAAEHYGVSRAVIREALMRLRDRGLVERNPTPSGWPARSPPGRSPKTTSCAPALNLRRYARAHQGLAGKPLKRCWLGLKRHRATHIAAWLASNDLKKTCTTTASPE